MCNINKHCHTGMRQCMRPVSPVYQYHQIYLLFVRKRERKKCDFTNEGPVGKNTEYGRLTLVVVVLIFMSREVRNHLWLYKFLCLGR